MTEILSSYAIERVRKNLDEILPNDSSMYISSGDSKDNPSLDDIIRRNLPEAINAIHLSAPVTTIMGEELGNYSLLPTGKQVGIDENGVMDFRINPPEGEPPLRIVMFKANDSNITVTDIIPEASPEGRKQLNRHIRGRSDRPRLVRWQQDVCRFTYYSMTAASVARYNNGQGDTDAADYFQLYYLPKAYYIAPTTTGSSPNPDPSYDIDSPIIEQNIIDYLTGLVLVTYSLNDKAKIFFDQSSIFH